MSYVQLGPESSTWLLQVAASTIKQSMMRPRSWALYSWTRKFGSSIIDRWYETYAADMILT